MPYSTPWHAAWAPHVSYDSQSNYANQTVDVDAGNGIGNVTGPVITNTNLDQANVDLGGGFSPFGGDYQSNYANQTVDVDAGNGIGNVTGPVITETNLDQSNIDFA